MCSGARPDRQIASILTRVVILGVSEAAWNEVRRKWLEPRDAPPLSKVSWAPPPRTGGLPESDDSMTDSDESFDYELLGYQLFQLNGRLRQRAPLSRVIDLYVEAWEDEGLAHSDMAGSS